MNRNKTYKLQVTILCLHTFKTFSEEVMGSEKMKPKSMKYDV